MVECLLFNYSSKIVQPSKGMCLAVVVALAFSVGAARPAMADDSAVLRPEELGGMDIDQLSRVQIVSATLTPTQTRLVPAKTTVLDQATIAQSGARYLN